MTHAIIKNQDGSTYVSPLFALKLEGTRSAAIGLDASLSHVQKLDFWQRNVEDHTLTRSLFIISNEYADAEKGWDGLNWVMGDQELMDRLLSGEALSLTEDSRFAPYAAPITLPAWIEVQTEADIRSLETVSFHFHDSEILDYAETNTDMSVKFDTTWGCFITVRFCGVTESDFKEKIGLILSSEIEKNAVGFTFTVTNGYGGWIDGVDFDTHAESPYIKCQKILWQIEIE